jgi:nucleoside-diphosphate-sugar epimerase
MVVLVTGGTGFLGSFIARTFVEEGEDLVLFDTHPNVERIKKIIDAVVVEEGSVTSWTDIVDVFKKHEIDAVIHTAADLSIRAEKKHYESFKTNVEGTLNLLEACRIFEVPRIIFTSSLSVYGPRSQFPITENSFRDPTSFYGATKACSEVLGTFYGYAHGIDFRTVRFPTLIGPYRRGMGASVTFSSFIDDAFTKGKAVIRIPAETKNPVLYVKDAVDFLYRLYRKERVSQPIFNVSGIPVSLEELMNAVKKFIPEFKPEFDVDKVAEQIARSWTVTTEMAIRAGIIDRYREVKELNWTLKYDTPEKIVRDHLAVLKSDLEG